MLACEEFFTAGGGFADIFRHDNFITMVAITLGCMVAMVGIIGGTIRGVVRSRAQEQTKRELAAYVAEGTLDPDKAIAMLNAGPAAGKCGQA